MTRKSVRGRRTSGSFMVPKAPESGLNAVFIRNLKPRPGGGMYEATDRGDTAYLRIRVTPRAKTFYMRVRWKEGAPSAASRARRVFGAAQRSSGISQSRAGA
ncbi:hypothetical protein C1D09_003820 [Mesorhizobium intechi]|uniref:DUF4102 domain-containing protein n=1 Tax=Mesorhizobium intechi TaxID=537601 RepID=A0A8T9AZS1_9HYPH|nr:hypothetical protein [Mesorhizobium intechi]TSE13471.1 hypothetical protein C1D09_003820 [Mesorhizobium intechi]